MKRKYIFILFFSLQAHVGTSQPYFISFLQQKPRVVSVQLIQWLKVFISVSAKYRNFLALLYLSGNIYRTNCKSSIHRRTAEHVFAFLKDINVYAIIRFVLFILSEFSPLNLFSFVELLELRETSLKSTQIFL